MIVRTLVQASNNGALAKLRGIDALQVGLARLAKLDRFLEFSDSTLRTLDKTQNGLLREYGKVIDVKTQDGKADRRYWVPPENADEYGERIEALLKESVEMAEPIEPLLALGDFYDDDTPEESYKLTADQARSLMRLGLLKMEDSDAEKPKPRRKSANSK